MNERKKRLKKKMFGLLKSLKSNIKSGSWGLVRINLIDLKYLLNQIENIKENEE